MITRLPSHRQRIAQRHSRSRQANCIEGLEARRLLTVFTVTTNADAGPGSLRQAILDANSDSAADQIHFDIGSGPQSIALQSALPNLVNSFGITIDGTTQTGYLGQPIIELNGLSTTNADGLHISNGPDVIRGLVINRFDSVGIQADASQAVTIEGCYIGTDLTGLIALGVTRGGITLSGCNSHVGADPSQRNVIGGAGSVSGDAAILIEPGAQGSVIQNNSIGVGSDGTTALPNSQAGIAVRASNCTIGGTQVGEGNVIANSGSAGVYVTPGNTAGSILGNSIHDNGGLGIDLVAFGITPDGVTLNDTTDADTGGNNLQNFPVLTSAVVGASTTVVSGSLTTTPSDTYRVEFFSSAAADSSGNGEGQVLLGSTTVVVDNSGTATFTATLPATVPAGQPVTATATDLAGSTSEFAADIPAVQALQPDWIVTGNDFGGPPVVKAFDPSGTQRISINAFDLGFLGGVRVATGDITGDGVPDIIVGTGSGAAHVKIFDGATQQQIAGPLGSFLVYPGPGNTPQDPNSDYYRLAFRGGIFVASGDYNHDGRSDLITAADAGAGPHVKVFSGTDGSLLASFFAFDPGFQGGVRVGTGDIDGDGTTDIIVGAGPGAGPHVKVFQGNTGFAPTEIRSFFAFNNGFDSGLYVAGGDINGGGPDEIVVGAGTTAVPHVKAFATTSNADIREVASFFAYSSPTGGARVAVADITGDGRDDIITGSGPGESRVRVFNVTAFTGLTPTDDFLADPSFTGGIYVG